MVSKAELGEVYWDLNALSQIKSSKEAVKEFEAYLFHLFLKEALPESSALFGSSFQGRVYRDMFTMELSREIAESDPLNLTTFVEEAISRYRSVGGE